MLSATSRLILEAPTGSGKSTQVPQFLLRNGFLDEGETVVLQPRRIAARMLARRVASELGEPLGRRIGYQVRHERHGSDRETRVWFATEGILLRRMISDPCLSGVSVLVFDEFHERNLHADVTLARAMQLQKDSRPDLKIIVMSATLDARELQQRLEPCARLRASGRTFPVRIRYLDARDMRGDAPVWDLAAEAVSQAVQTQSQGHALVFMPGAFEIGRTIAALADRLPTRDFELLPLHGELSSEAQDRALAQGSRRKVVVATNVAETSLTIPDVRIVVDSGQARIARYDPTRGINTLWIEKISDASANQRAGRAGRTAEGLAVRLWPEREHASRDRFDTPEVQRVELSEILLSLLATGIGTAESFEWFEEPRENRLADALSLLQGLKAIDRQGRLSSKGRRMSEFPLHPRHASILMAADRYGCVEEMAVAVAIAQSRGVFLRKLDRSTAKRRESLAEDAGASDLLAQVEAWQSALDRRFDIGFCRDHGLHAQACRQVLKVANQLSQAAEAAGMASRRATEPEALHAGFMKSLLSGYPDRLCRRIDRGTLRCEMVGQRRGDLARESVVGEASLFVACEVNEIGSQGGKAKVVFNLCTAVEEAWLKELFPQLYAYATETSFDQRQKRVVERRVSRFQDLEIASHQSAEPDPAAAAEVFARMVSEGNARLANWDESVEHYIRKVNLLAQALPEYGLDAVDADSRALLREQCCFGARSLKDLKRKEVLPELRLWVGQAVDALVQKELPDRLQLSNGKPARLRVEQDGALVLSAKIQCLYGLKDAPKFCRGRIKPKIELLAPNMRPVQMTEDLQSFWMNSYQSIKKELRGRYPKHEWR